MKTLYYFTYTIGHIIFIIVLIMAILDGDWTEATAWIGFIGYSILEFATRIVRDRIKELKK